MFLYVGLKIIQSKQFTRNKGRDLSGVYFMRTNPSNGFETLNPRTEEV